AILVPGTRIEIAEPFVLHKIHFTEELDPHLVGIAVIDGDVVADDMAAGTPHQMNVVLSKPIAGYLNFGPVFHLKRNMMELRYLIDYKIDRVVIRSAAKEGECIIAPVGHTKAEYVGIELHDLLHVGDAVRYVSQLERHDPALSRVLLCDAVFGNNFDRRMIRIFNYEDLSYARRNRASELAFNTMRR